jgi:hypothetical protein
MANVRGVYFEMSWYLVSKNKKKEILLFAEIAAGNSMAYDIVARFGFEMLYTLFMARSSRARGPGPGPI